MTQKEIEKHYRKLEKTMVLSEYFPEGFQFKIDLYDPIVEDLRESMLAMGSKDNAYGSEALVPIFLRGIKRHITLSERFQVLQHLESVLPRVSLGHKKAIQTLFRTLPDTSIANDIFGLLFELYRNSIINVMLQREKADIIPKDDSMVEQVKTVCQNASAAQIASLRQKDDVAVAAIEWLYYMTEDKKLLAPLLELITNFGSYRAAHLLFECVSSTDWQMRYLSELVNQKPIFPFLLDYVRNAMDKTTTGLLDRWGYYDFLLRIDPFLAFPYLRKEFGVNKFWTESMSQVNPNAVHDFFIEITEWLIKIDDRRIVPTFIRFLADQTSDSLMTSVKIEVKNLVLQSQWAEEIQTAFRRLSVKEAIFVDQLILLFDYLNEENKTFFQLHKMIYGRSPTTEELQDHIKEVQKHWNESYHEQLDGLRPIDIEATAAQKKFTERMLNDFQKNHGQKNIPQKELRILMAKFQNRWFITPLPESGQIPTVLLFQSFEQSAQTPALKYHYQNLKEERILSLYYLALIAYEAQEYDEARKNLAALLALAPEHPFANWLMDKVSAARGKS